MNDGVQNTYNNFKKKYGDDVIINGVTYRAVIQDSTTDNFIKTIQLSRGILKFGDYVIFHDKSRNIDETYLITAKVAPKVYYDEAELSLCNAVIKFRATLDDVEGSIVSFPTYINQSVISVVETDHLSYSDSNVFCCIGYSLLWKIIDIHPSFRLIINGWGWTVDGIDNITHVINKQQGTITYKLKAELTQSGNDDLINEVAHNEVNPIVTTPHDYTMTITELNKNIENTRTSQISNIVCTQDGVIVEQPKLNYLSSDTNIATCDGYGLITAIGVGSASITVTYKNVSTVIALNIIEYVEVYTLDGVSSVNDRTSQNYKMIDESRIISTREYTFAIDDNTLATIENVNTNNVDIIGKNIEGTMILTATDTLNGLTYTKSINTIFNAHAYTIDISETTASIQVGNTHQLSVVCTDDGDTVTSPIVTYSSDNTAISTCDANGLVTSVSEGSNNITCTYENATDSIAITIIPVPVVKTYKIVASVGTIDREYISHGSKSDFHVVNSDGTAITTGEVFTFTLTQSIRNPSITPETLITLVTIMGSTRLIMTANSSIAGWFNLVATTGDNNVTTKEMRVKIGF
ncbi:Ig-like domain-containing protein [Clostridium estertheticum]|uniref:Ig-like domain-containing protein n=1 Tax=Clostridium estertheticum TaxID=238834 RepID=UPI001C6E4ED8|nr:Ig-like domain-containing protein [Clostridium estertheticum]MBW9169761.1 Ig-like domain-containing protein [Clostridium estertheticum]WLC74733.1 Ig-like domain-containing protein [Clostridium estertheticum]